MEQFENETLDYVFEYRGISVQVWNDDYGQQKFVRFLNDPIFGTQDISLGSFNANYEEDIKYIIDDNLDTIYKFSTPYHGAKLKWFDNGYNGDRDIKLENRSRLMYVWLVADPLLVDFDKIKEEAKMKLDKFQASTNIDKTAIIDVTEVDN